MYFQSHGYHAGAFQKKCGRPLKERQWQARVCSNFASVAGLPSSSGNKYRSCVCTSVLPGACSVFDAKASYSSSVVSTRGMQALLTGIPSPAHQVGMLSCETRIHIA